MSKPKFKIGQKVRIIDSDEVYVIGKIVDCIKTFEYSQDDENKWAYGTARQQNMTCKFEQFLELVTPLEELL